VIEVVIASAARTAIGSFGRSLRDIPPTELGATVAGVAIERAGLEPDQVEQVVFGNVIHTAPEDMYMARVVGIRAGIPKEAPAFTVNRLCGSGVQAIVSAAQAIQTGDAEIVLAGGAESMSRGAYWVENGRWGARIGDTAVIDAVVGCLTDPFNQIHMGVTAENVAESHGISRDAQDEFALESHRRAQAAIEAGLFDEEVVTIEVKARKGTLEFRVDEHLRRDATLEMFTKLKPAFKKDGTVTAGNASGVNDAGAAVVVMSARRAQELSAPVRTVERSRSAIRSPPPVRSSRPRSSARWNATTTSSGSSACASAAARASQC
jgi:acetyl-CoA C-acetyltransferase